MSQAAKHSMQKVEYASFPLTGQSLIEASAGTGKTYTIAELYNRLILGQDCTPLDCTQILVVTFTNAATEELRGRLRERIQVSLQQVLQLQQGVTAKENEELATLAPFIAGLSAEEQAQLILRLKHNLTLMDEASIYTIHSFCQRMLQRFAFDTGVLFNAEMILSANEYLQQACQDVWRQEIYGLTHNMARGLRQKGVAGPESLLAMVKGRMNKQDAPIEPQIQKSYTEAWQAFEDAFMRARAELEQSSVEELADIIAQSTVKKNTYSKRHVPNWLNKISDYLQAEPSLSIPDCLVRFFPSTLIEAMKSPDDTPPQHPFFDTLETIQTAQQEVELVLKQGWFQEVCSRFYEILEQHNLLSSDDLIRVLERSLTSNEGVDSSALAAQIRELYPVAMIDEFQDTDNQQYAIFNTVYPHDLKQEQESTAKNSHALIMIGDPKQAIYSFRGADIFTYMKAKANLPQERRFTLDTNFRSHSQLIAGVNCLYETAENPFEYQDEIPFEAVGSGMKNEHKAFRLGNTPQTPLQVFFDREGRNNENSLTAAAAQCAEKISQLLAGEAYLGDRLVQAGDIMVLVRSGRQAKLIQDALRHVSVNSVYLSQESVLKSPEAQALLYWLRAVVQPRQERLLRMSLASEVQNHSAEQLARYLTDEQAWEEVLEQYQHYHELLVKRGVMAALMAWLEQDNLAGEIRLQPDGERKLTNLLHLGDLLQTQSRQLQGHESLLRWLHERVLNDEEVQDEAQLRLESDANLVSIMTIHRSKGLQFPLVFLPFTWNDSSELRSTSDIYYYDEEKQQVVLTLDANQQQIELAEKAERAENARLLYVALTRAEQGCFVWLMNNLSRKQPVGYKSALGALLGLKPKQDVPWDDLKETYGSAMLIDDLPEWQLNARTETTDLAQEIEAQQVQTQHFDYWRVSSYSALASARSAISLAEAAEGLQKELPVEIKEDENWSSDGLQLEPKSYSSLKDKLSHIEAFGFSEEALALTFQKGAQAGNCLHDILEDWDFHNLEQLPELCQKYLQRYNIQLEEERLPEFTAWLQAMVQTPMVNAWGDTFRLTDIAPASRLSEMEFHFALANTLKPTDLGPLLEREHQFAFVPLQGFLKGFIDLTFEYQGRYYVADYKSNFLGTELVNYVGEPLYEAMVRDNYDLQAWVYTLALDALLRLRLGVNYDPEQHLGGVYYYFLRGMQHAPEKAQQFAKLMGQGAGVYYQAPDLTRLEQWRQVFFIPEEVRA